MSRRRKLRASYLSAVLVLCLCGIVSCGGGGTQTSTPPPSDPVISSLVATPSAISPGQSSTLTWQVSGASSLQLTNVTTAPPVASTSLIVTPAVTTTYMLTATNTVGSAQSTVTVNVSQAAPVASLTINAGEATQPIAPNFLGIGHNMGDTLSLIGTSPTNMNPIYEQLIKNLTQYANAPILIREASEDSSGAANPDIYDAPRLAALAQLNTDVGAHFMIGVDFVDDVVSTATSEAQELVAALPGSLDAIELGDEPDLYGINGERSEGAAWDYADYLADYQQFAPAILAASNGVKLEAPVFSGVNATASFMANVNSFVSGESSQLAVVTVHHYSGNGCNGATEPADYLLTEAAVDGGTQPLGGPVEIGQYLTAAQQASLPFRIGELNSINCGGQLGVSNSFSSALWAMDIAFAYANAGVNGVNFLATADPNNADAYTPFDFTYTETSGIRTYSIRNINPLYYGMLLFAQAVQNKAQLLPVSIATNANIKAWATIDSNKTIRLLLLNKDETTSGAVSISLPSYGQATITRLTAPSYSSTTGVVLGGQTFDGSTNGTPQGSAYSEIVQSSAGTYTVALPSVSAALVTIQQ
jgi:hypothetical protein